MDDLTSASPPIPVPAQTLEQLLFSLRFCLPILVVILFLFAIAIRCQSTYIAPRCDARPRQVIFNPHRPKCDSSQDRGNPFLLGWVPWVLSLNYDTLIRGVPGTGTRNGGLSGKLLRVNLDYIVVLRLHVLYLRIAWVSTQVYMIIVLPIYFLAQCADVPVPLGNDTVGEIACEDVPDYNLTDYQRLTMGNLPELSGISAPSHDEIGDHLRFFVVVFCSWYVCWYACYLLHREWVDLLAIRRVYYLECDHWRCRKEELQMDDTDDHHLDGVEEDNPFLEEREAWIPHPELRDTVPNIGLYSVLVGGIPSRPMEAMTKADVEAAIAHATEKGVDWQLDLVTSFFHSCTPKQPGYSSSVAAVTVIPSAKDLATIWGKWYRVSSRMMRLRLIRRKILRMGHVPKFSLMPQQKNSWSNGAAKDQELPRDETQPLNHGESSTMSQNKKSIHGQFEFLFHRIRRRQKSANARVPGQSIISESEEGFWRSLNLGIEQTEQMANEMARVAGGCCPYGFCDQRITYCDDIKELWVMEEDAVEDFQEAYAELAAAAALATSTIGSDSQLTEHRGVFRKSQQPDLESGLKTEIQLTQMHARQGHRSSIERSHHKGNGLSSSDAAIVEAGNEDSAHGHGDRGASSKDSSNLGLYTSLGLSRRASVAWGIAPRESEETTLKSFAQQDPWDIVLSVAEESEAVFNQIGAAGKHKVARGWWKWPGLQNFVGQRLRTVASMLAWMSKSSEEAADIMARDSSFAIVTFTSRQAAVAARKCLADGRGAGRFLTSQAIPIPPLADASAFNITDTRGYCRPVTLGINDRQKLWRHNIAAGAVVLICIFYTFPITFVATNGAAVVKDLFPGFLEQWNIQDSSVDATIETLLLNVFLSILPQVFQWLSNFGSNATSLAKAEYVALQWYWIFMSIFAIVGGSIGRMAWKVLEGGTLNAWDTLQEVAQTIPTEVSFTWLNWILQRFCIFHPLFYLLQFTTFFFGILGMGCCARMLQGGGTGSRMPYRLYVEGSVVLLCTTALAPAAPLVAPCAAMYFLLCIPMLRYVVIFTYRPDFDTGGVRWIKLFDICIYCLLLGQLLLSGMMFLRKAVIQGGLVIISMVPIVAFRRTTLDRFLEAYKDAALLQTSLLDGWDPETPSSAQSREKFRRFLVDSHKAAYIPACIAAAKVDHVITAEPAVSLPNQPGDCKSAGSKDPHLVADIDSGDNTKQPFQQHNRVKHVAELPPLGERPERSSAKPAPHVNVVSFGTIAHGTLGEDTDAGREVTLLE